MAVRYVGALGVECCIKDDLLEVSQLAVRPSSNCVGRPAGGSLEERKGLDGSCSSLPVAEYDRHSDLSPLIVYSPGLFIAFDGPPTGKEWGSREFLMDSDRQFLSRV